jgi:hypothetical protein
MPPQNRVGRHNRRDPTEATTAQSVAVPRQPPAFLIGEAEPATHVPAEDAIFFDQVGHGLLLPLVEPADQRCQEPAEGRRVEHGVKVYTTGRSQGLKDSRPSNETLRPRGRRDAVGDGLSNKVHGDGRCQLGSRDMFVRSVDV